MRASTSILPVMVCLGSVCGLMFNLLPLSAAVPGDEHWDYRFGPVGTSDPLWAIAQYRGNMYVGGTFTAAGNTRANLIAGFDGTNWFALNNGMPTDGSLYVWALAAWGTNLYAGGNFTNADNSGAMDIARWDGSSWYPMGSGLPGYVFSLKAVGTNLYAGGIFVANTNGPTYSCLARWDATNWSLIPGDFAGPLPVVYSVGSDGTNVFVAGVFTGVAGINTTNVAGWNGSSWFALGSGIRGNLWTLLYQGNKLYAGGAFTNSSGTTFTNLAVWDGSSWSAWVNTDRAVRDLLSDGTNIYVGGDFTTIAGISASRIARWNGASWSALGAGLSGFGVAASPGIYKMGFDSKGRLVAAGNFNQVGGIGASHVAVWDGTNWFGLGGSISKGLTHFVGTVSALLSDGTNVYAGGIFSEAGDQIVNAIAKWDGTNWSTLAGGMLGGLSSSTPSIRALARSGKNLYAGGNFTNAGGVAASGIARWDGNSWSALGSGADAPVSALAVSGSSLYVGGTFTNIGGITTPGFAYWNGSGWGSVGPLSGGSRSVNAIAVDGSAVYIGGSFTSILGVSANYIAKWDGAAWSALGSGLNNTVSAIAASNGVVYACGNFTTAGGVSANRIAKWDGSSWSALGSGLVGNSSGAAAMVVALNGNNVYVGGTFTNAGAVLAPGIAMWDGANWYGLGSGLIMNPGTSSARALAFKGNDLYVGGMFIFAGDKPSMFIGRWNDQLNFYPPPHLQLTRSGWVTNGQFRFRVSGTSGQSYIIQSSTNLGGWTPLLTNSATIYDFTDSSASNYTKQFYRAVLGP